MSGPRRPNARAGRVLVERPDRAGHLRLDVAGRRARGAVEDTGGRHGPADALEPDAVEQKLAERLRARRAAERLQLAAGRECVTPAGAENDGMNAGSPRGSFG